jgi:ornithine carbamoyltransferase
MIKHFIDLNKIPTSELHKILLLAKKLKKDKKLKKVLEFRGVSTAHPPQTISHAHEKKKGQVYLQQPGSPDHAKGLEENRS